MSLKKRIIGTILFKENIAVQSFGYKKWLPLGEPECLAANLDNWGADEIVFLDIDTKNSGINFKLIEKIGSYGLSTPLSYGGGIENSFQAQKIISLGFERIIIDNALNGPFENIEDISYKIGKQALIASLPLVKENNEIKHLSYRTFKKSSIKIEFVKKIDKCFSEILIIDSTGEGKREGFNLDILKTFECFTRNPILVFGGIDTAVQVREILSRNQIAAVLIGNSLNYRENGIAKLKESLLDLPIRVHDLK